jgi:transcriptional regulator
MYIPSHFEESRIDTLHDLIRTYPFATLVTMSSGGINANHIPLHLSAEPGSNGILCGHVSRANPIWNDLTQGVEALAIFQGPNTYISPSWYPTKQEHGKVVPTWNYTAVHAYGTLRVIDDPVWLRSQLDALTAQHESAFEAPWAIADAPPEFIDRMLGTIVGIELVITNLSGKWKVSQNQPVANREGVMQGLQKNGDSNAVNMAAMIRDTTQ